MVHPREVIEGALKNNAVSLILVHNHPSGSPTPSQNDRAVTRELVYAGSIMQIRVLDHIIIGDNTYFSFAAQGLIGEYELDFLRLKTRGTSKTRRRPGKSNVPGTGPYCA